LEYSRLAHGFLEPKFTLAQLRKVYEAVLQRRLDPGNFRRMVETSGQVEPTGEHLAGTKHRPPQLYRFNTAQGLIDPDPLTVRTALTQPGVAS
jgi:8-oxo-dGTP diphosphatase